MNHMLNCGYEVKLAIILAEMQFSVYGSFIDTVISSKPIELFTLNNWGLNPSYLTITPLHILCC